MLFGYFYLLLFIGGGLKNVKIVFFYILQKKTTTIKKAFYLGNVVEQFQYYPIIPLRLGSFDISVTNGLIISGLIIFATIVFALVFVFDINNKIIPRYWQILVEAVHKFTLDFLKGNIPHERADYFFPWVSTAFKLLLCMNLIGLIPYGFAITSHLNITFTIALGAFVGVNYSAVKKHGLKVFKLFLPPESHFSLALLLIPIEFISYLFRPISLSIRLFANIMAGHTLLKVMAGFVIAIIGVKGLLALGTYPILFLVTLLFFLEFFVSIIQSYVFAVLISIYINDALNLH